MNEHQITPEPTDNEARLAELRGGLRAWLADSDQDDKVISAGAYFSDVQFLLKQLEAKDELLYAYELTRTPKRETHEPAAPEPVAKPVCAFRVLDGFAVVQCDPPGSVVASVDVPDTQWIEANRVGPMLDELRSSDKAERDAAMSRAFSLVLGIGPTDRRDAFLHDLFREMTRYEAAGRSFMRAGGTEPQGPSFARYREVVQFYYELSRSLLLQCVEASLPNMPCVVNGEQPIPEPGELDDDLRQEPGYVDDELDTPQAIRQRRETLRRSIQAGTYKSGPAASAELVEDYINDIGTLLRLNSKAGEVYAKFTRKMDKLVLKLT